MTPNVKGKSVPMDSWWVHNPAGPETSLYWQRSRGSLCAYGQNISAQDHIHVSVGIKWESPNFTFSWPSPLHQCLSYRLVTHYCLEMIMIKFPLTISSITCRGQQEMWMKKIEIGPLPYTTLKKKKKKKLNSELIKGLNAGSETINQLEENILEKL